MNHPTGLIIIKFQIMGLLSVITAIKAGNSGGIQGAISHQSFTTHHTPSYNNNYNQGGGFKGGYSHQSEYSKANQGSPQFYSNSYASINHEGGARGYDQGNQGYYQNDAGYNHHYDQNQDEYVIRTTFLL